MANRRSVFDSMSPASTMTPKGGSMTAYGEAEPETTMESKETMRRRTTPIVGEIQPRPTTLQEILAMLNGAQ